ncbi:MAG: hypothetical protein ACLQHK_01640 [Gallionellaceae bacterium]
MIRISLPYIYAISEAVEPLSKIAVGTKHINVIYDLYQAQSTIEVLINQSVFASSLRSCRPAANKLIGLLKGMTSNENFDRELDYSEVIPLQSAYQEFKIAFLAETGIFPSYFVTQKEPFDTLILLDKGVSLFPEDLSIKVPTAIFDAQEAGKAIAYELGTAAGFHIFRVVESVLRHYYKHVANGAAQPKVRSIKIYTKAFRRNNCGDEKILAALDQIADFHRNPLIHPEASLTVNEAISILGISRSVVTAMLMELPTP